MEKNIKKPLELLEYSRVSSSVTLKKMKQTSHPKSLYYESLLKTLDNDPYKGRVLCIKTKKILHAGQKVV